MRWIIALLLVAVLPAPLAFGTAQRSEVLHINGRVVSLLTTPLDPVIGPLLERRKDLREHFRAPDSGLWRGYVGTWHIEGDRLYLVSLSNGADKPKSIPLSTLLLAGDGPVPATWFSGTLRVPVGWARRYIHRGFATTWNQELLIRVERGRVLRQETLDVVQALRGRSRVDLSNTVWGPRSPAKVPVATSGPWIDARSIGTASFRRRVASGTSFVTRGQLARAEGSPHEEPHRWLLVPRTPVTKAVEFRMATDLGLSEDDVFRCVEIDAIWREEEGRVLLDVRWIRFLARGETIHHPQFPLPALPERPTEEARDDWDEGLHYALFNPVAVGTAQDLDAALFSRRVQLHGTLTAGTPAQVLGADVAADEDLEGKAVTVSGSLQKWVITKRLLAVDHPDIAPFRERGPGTYYRVVLPDSGDLARPRAAR